MPHKTEYVEIKEIDREHLTVGGYGVVFGGRDLEGEYFTEDTDFWTDRLSETPPVLYSHGLDESLGRSVIGKVTRIVKDKVGVWIEAQLDRAHEYAQAVREMIEKGLLGWSMGSAGHLIEVDLDGKIISWPLVEASLTPSPCEPRTLGVAQVKSLYPDLEIEPRVELATEDGQIIIRLHGLQ